MPTATATANRIRNIHRASLGNIASITNASSPEDAIIIATRAPKLTMPCVYRDTAAKPPMQPGMSPSSAETTTWPALLFRRAAKRPPRELMFSVSMSIIITTTSPAISTAFLSESSMRSTIIGVSFFCAHPFRVGYLVYERGDLRGPPDYVRPRIGGIPVQGVREYGRKSAALGAREL